MGKSIQLAAPEAGRRRRYTPEQKHTLLQEAARPGASISSVARTYGIAPSVMFLWKRTMDDAGEEGLKANEKVVPESELKKLEARIRELERALGRKTMEVELLQEAVRLTEKRKPSSRGSSSKKDGGR
jgi:transposase